MTKKKHRIISLFLAILLMLYSIPIVFSDSTEELSLNVTNPFQRNEELPLGNGGYVYSSSFRIPAMVTLKNGTIVAAADVRWNTTYDGGGLDTIVARSTDGGVSWSYTLANYLGDNNDTYNGSSTCFIDPCLTVAADGQTVYMLVDLYPYGVALNGEKETLPEKEVGFTGDGYLKLFRNSDEYYLNGNKIYNSSGEEEVGYTVDEYFNLYYNGTLISNLFYADSRYKVARTGFLYLTKSTDGGETWSAPKLLNLKTSSEMVCLVGPGRGITTKDGTMIFPVYSYNGSESSQRTGFIYSKDGENWQRVQGEDAWSSESAVVEIGQGVLRFFFRNGTTNLTYVDYNMTNKTWGFPVSTGIKINSNTQLSAITYSRTSDGKQVVLVSCPKGPGTYGSSDSNGAYRLNGHIYAGIVGSDGKMTWSDAINVSGTNTASSLSGSTYTASQGFFAYSCLTERADGSIAILYENHQNGWGGGSENYYYKMEMKAYSATDLGLTLDDAKPDVPSSPSNEISSNGVTVSDGKVTFTDLTVTSGTNPTDSFVKNALSYNVVPQTIVGTYSGSAKVTIDIPSGWDESKVFGYVKEENGTTTVLAGSAKNGKFTFTTSHFPQVGIFEATDVADISNVKVILGLGDVTAPISVSNSSLIGNAGTYMTSDGVVRYTITHENSNNFELDNDGIDSGSEYLITLDGSCAVDTYSTADNKWYTQALPIESIELNGEEDLSDFLWTITTTNGGYYIQNPEEDYMTIQTGYYTKQNYTVTLSDYSSICDITQVGDGYRIFANGSNIGLNDAGGERICALGWTDANNTVWNLYKKSPVTNTSVVFSALNITSGTDVVVGNTTYTVIVRTQDVALDLTLETESQLELDALASLGFDKNNFTATYVESKDENDVITLVGNQITTSDRVGDATVVATITDTLGESIGTVTYNITVSDVIIENVENVYVPVNGTATIQGISGEINTRLFDDNIATYTENSSGGFTFTGVSDGKTSLIVGTTQIDVYVSPECGGKGADTSKTIYINIEKIDHCTIYYAINGGTLHKVEGEGILIDQTYTDGFNIMFFAAPDQGYALTTMKATDSNGQYYSLSDVVEEDGTINVLKSEAWPFNPEVNIRPSTIPTDSGSNAWKSQHGYKWALIEGNMDIDGLEDLFNRAVDLEADGTITFTKNGDSGLSTNIEFIAEKLPTIESIILLVNGEPYVEGMTVKFGDVITYQYTITSYSSGVEYSNVILRSDDIGFYQPISEDVIAVPGSYQYTAEYVVTADDLEKYATGNFVSNSVLYYDYKSTLSNGGYYDTDSSSVSCKIAGIVYYTWMEGTPEAITGDATTFPLPAPTRANFGSTITVNAYNGQQNYTVTENGYIKGTWRFVGWKYGDEFYDAGSTVVMPIDDSAQFVGVWEFVAAPTYTVTYVWSNAPEGLSDMPYDANEYYKGQKYVVDGTYFESFVIDDGTYIWTFSGWKLGNSVVSGEQTMGEGDVVLVGKWTNNAKLTSLVISKEGYSEHEDVDPLQTFMFHIEGDGVDLIVTTHGEESVTIVGLKVDSTYTVTEITDWSWRYEFESWSFSSSDNEGTTSTQNTATIELAESENELVFVNKRTALNWLDGNAYAVNVFNKKED